MPALTTIALVMLLGFSAGIGICAGLYLWAWALDERNERESD